MEHFPQPIRLMSAPPRWPTVAYFSMEVALDPAVPTYGGGLGILAGDTLRAAADLGVPMVGVTLLYRKGCAHQRLDARGNQTEEQALWGPEDFLVPLAPPVAIMLEGRHVHIRAWRFMVEGSGGESVPVYLLDTDLPENGPDDRAITDYLYGGDERYRLRQEALLGLGGLAILRALGHASFDCYHLNEGHTAFAPVALLQERVAGRASRPVARRDVAVVQAACVFTTHTPVPAGHDVFPKELVRRVLGDARMALLDAVGCGANGSVNMTELALALSRYANGVSVRHGATARGMFPGDQIESITNGVHAETWTSAPFQQLFDHHIPTWRRDNFCLRNAIDIPAPDVLRAHAEAKRAMLAEVERRTGVCLDPRALTIGFARRATAYKRAALAFSDLGRLRAVVERAGPIQFVFSGKAHSRDEGGKALIREIFSAADALRDAVQVVYLEDYQMALGLSLCSGVDLWLNTPEKPKEASGTSGMKAALNGVPSLSVLDGWWVEGHIEDVTGWAIEEPDGPGDPAQREAASLYDKLEKTIVPMFYRTPEAYACVMRAAIALNGSYFHAQRMLLQYLASAYAAPGRRHVLDFDGSAPGAVVEGDTRLRPAA